MLSPVNNGDYERTSCRSEIGSGQKRTWFQERLNHVRERQSMANFKPASKRRGDDDMRAM